VRTRTGKSSTRDIEGEIRGQGSEVQVSLDTRHFELISWHSESGLGGAVNKGMKASAIWE
jgi:hypothetical protein